MAREAKFTHLYHRKAWRTLRAAHLAENPVCVQCAADGKLNDGSWHPDGSPEYRRRFLVVDHIIPHRGDMELFLDPENLQTLCRTHHDAHKTQDDARGYSTAIGADGFPLDPAHPAIGKASPTPALRERFSLPPGIRPSAIPVVLVCGPPYGGKTTWIRENARDEDVVIEYDAICMRVNGTEGISPTDPRRKQRRRRVYRERDRLILSLSERSQGIAYLESRAPSIEERERWSQALVRMRTEEIDPGKETCLARIEQGIRMGSPRDLALEVERWYLSAARTSRKARTFERRQGYR